MLILNSLNRAQQNVPEKSYKPRTVRILSFSEIALFSLFFAHTFFRNIFLNPKQFIRNQHTILRFFIPHTNSDEKQIFLFVIWALFANFECICSKNSTFSDILQKVKTYCFAKSYYLLLNPFNTLKSIKFKSTRHNCLYLALSIEG